MPLNIDTVMTAVITRLTGRVVQVGPDDPVPVAAT